MTGPSTPVSQNLSAPHQNLLTDSAISPAVVEARGYRTVTVKAELERLGFGRNQLLVPALLIPIHGVTGQIVNYMIRPDQPRIKNGKPRKYEFPAASRMTLDVHPHIRHLLADPAVSLWITEGSRKADAAISIGLCCLSIPGVWNWRGTNELGGRTALADWESVDLKQRDVFIAYDSDVMLKPQVHGALARLGAFLESRGARVRYIYLPSGPGGAKVGLDDYLATGRSVDDLLSIASADLRRLPQEETEPPYAVTATGMVWRKPTEGGSVDVLLANFSAVITDDIVQDDGLEQRREFVLETSVRGRVERITIPAGQFPGMSWVSEHLGAGAVLYPGMGTKEHMRCAILLLSGELPEHRVYAHTGWRQIDGDWVYLHAGGAIGADGAVAGVEVVLDNALSRISLPEPQQGAELREATSAALALLDLLPPDVAYPLLGAVGLAPLRDPLGEEAPDFTLWFHGPSGSFKSEVQALGQSFFGDFSRQSLPVNFSATANAVERFLFEAKDALLAIDDYHPASDRREQQAMDQVANRLLRGAGNRSGRARMYADTRLRPPLVPRALPIVSGERLPQGHSTNARMFPIAVTKDAIDPAKLTQAQDQKAHYPHAMAGYLHSLAQRFEPLQATLPARFRALRDEVQLTGGHRREPGQVAHMLLGLETLFEVAVEHEALTRDVAEGHLRRARAVLLAHAREHGETLAEEAPEHLFLRLLSDGFAGKTAYLEDAHGGSPDDAEQWGWETVARQDPYGIERESLQHPPRAQLVGVLEEDWLLLYPNQVYAFVVEAAGGIGRTFPVEKRTLLHRLDEAGLVETTLEGPHRRREINVWINGRSKRVIKLRRDALQDSVSTPWDREEREGREGIDESVVVGAGLASRSTGKAIENGKEPGAAMREPEPILPALPALPGSGGEESSDPVVVEEPVEWEATL